MTNWTLRLRSALDEYFGIVVLALVVLALLGGWMAYTAHVNPGTHVETRAVGSWEETGAYTHQATVTENTTVYPVGTTLENRSVYFTQISPVLNGTFRYGYTATGEGTGDLAVDVTTSLVLRSVDQSGQRTTEYWQVTEELGGREASLAPGESVRVSFSRNVNRTRQRLDDITEEFGSPGTTQALVVSRVRYEGTVNGQQVEDTRRYALAIEPDERTYRVDDPGPVANTSEQTEQVRVPNEYGPLRRVGGPLVVALSLLGLVGLVAGRQWGGLAVGRPERERLAFERHREEYDDWITTGRLPADVFDGPTIEVGTLEGLVDVAIDTNERVIEDAESDRFVVLRDDLRYVYEPPAPPADVTDEPPDHSDRATDGEAEPETSTE